MAGPCSLYEVRKELSGLTATQEAHKLGRATVKPSSTSFLFGDEFHTEEVDILEYQEKYYN